MSDSQNPKSNSTDPTWRGVQSSVDVSAAAQSEGKAFEEPAPKRRSKRDQKIEKLAEFIAFVYSRKGKRVVLKPKVKKLICQKPTLEDSELNQLLDLARGDVRLSIPRQLLLVAFEVSHPVLRTSLLEFVGIVLRAHPVFASEEMSAALRNLPGGPDVGDALATIASMDYSKLAGLPEKVRRKKADLAALRANATYCLGLWFVETRSVTNHELAQHLFSVLWQPQRESTQEDLRQLRLLTENRDLDAVGAACESFKNRADEMASLAGRARRGEAEALETASSLAAAASQLKEELKARQAKIVAVERDMTQQRQNHENELAHLRDDHENLRARVLRRIREDVNLLDEGLHALQREPPKVRVMEDHAERALDGLRSEIKQLEAEN